MIQKCNSIDEYKALLADSEEQPLFIFKHSTACPVSALAHRSFEKFAENVENARFAKVLVIQNRDLSNYIAEHSGIRHESPQVILFFKNKPVWHESHWSISQKSLAKALEKVLASELD
jgi:bacillithiol system protein YtxJ